VARRVIASREIPSDLYRPTRNRPRAKGEKDTILSNFKSRHPSKQRLLIRRTRCTKRQTSLNIARLRYPAALMGKGDNGMLHAVGRQDEFIPVAEVAALNAAHGGRPAA
jgi:hypothetical protein